MAKIKTEKPDKVDPDAPSILTLSQIYSNTKNRKVIPCTLSSDIGLSGGVPMGSMILVAGKYKSGKTTLCLQYAANAQRLFGSDVFIFPPEGRLTSQTLDQVQGFDRDKVKVILPPAIYNKNDELVGYRKWPAQTWFDHIGNTIQDNPGSVVILDSLSSLSTDKEQSENVGSFGRGEAQKIEAQFCRKFGSLVISSNVAFFVITQTQANTSGYGATVQIKAGNAIKFQADIIMFCKFIEKWPETKGKILGHDTKYSIECSALGPPCDEICVPLRYGFGIDVIKDIQNHAILWGIITRTAAWYWLPFLEKDGIFEYKSLDDILAMGEEVSPVKCNGEEGLWLWLKDHPRETEILDKVIREKIL